MFGLDLPATGLRKTDLGMRVSVATTADNVLLGEGSGAIKVTCGGGYRSLLRSRNRVSVKKTNMGALEAGRRARW